MQTASCANNTTDFRQGGRELLAVVLLATGGLLLSSFCQAEGAREAEWLGYLKHPHADTAMPYAYREDDELISVTGTDLARLTGRYDEDEEHHSKMQFSQLNYQADVSESYLQIRLFYQF